MSEAPRPTEASRWFVLVVAVICYSAAAVVYLQAPDHYLIGVSVLGVVGTIFLALYLFGTTLACDRAVDILTLGGWL